MTDIERYAPPAPTVTEREIVMIERQAAILARSDLVGDLKGKPADIAVVGLQALALGVPFNAAFSELFVINKKVVLSARIRVALARRAGHEVWFEESTPDTATCSLRRRGEQRVHRLTCTIEEARTAGLTSKDVWKKFPADMLRATVARKLVAIAAQDVMLGIPGADLVTVDYDDQVDDIPDDTLEIEHRSAAPSVDDAPIAAPTPEQRAELRRQIEDLDPDQRDWLYQQAKAAGLPNIGGTRFQAAHREQLAALIEAALEIIDEHDDFDDRLDQAMADAGEDRS